MITTSCGGALIAIDQAPWNVVMMYATQYRERYPYFQHEKIGNNYRMSNICAGIGRGLMTVADKLIEHYNHIKDLYKGLLADVPGVELHDNPARYDSNFWLNTISIDPIVRVVGQENACKAIVKGAVGGAAGVIHMEESVTTDCRKIACRRRECSWTLPALRLVRSGSLCTNSRYTGAHRRT